MHEAQGRLLLRAFVPGADEVEVVSRDGEPLGTLSRKHAVSGLIRCSGSRAQATARSTVTVLAPAASR